MSRGYNVKIYMKVDSSDMTNALKEIGAWDGKARLGVENAMKKGTKDIRRDAAQRAAVRSGKLKKSLKTRFRITKCEGQVYTKLPYAHIVEYGAKAHNIKPKEKKALRFYKDGEPRFARKARIPKFTAKPYLRPAYDYISPDIVKNIKKAVRKP